MVVNKIITAGAVGLLIVSGVLLWRLNVVSDSLTLANEKNGQLEQSNKQLAVDLAAERQTVVDLQSSYEREASNVAELVARLEKEQADYARRIKGIYDAANQSSCGTQPLPDELIRLRQSRTGGRH